MKQAEALHNDTSHIAHEREMHSDHTPKDEIQHLLDTAETYFKTRKDLLQLKLVSKASDIISSAVSGITSVIFFLFFFIILNIGLGLLLGELFDKTYYGFFALAGLYLLLGILILTVGNKMIKRSVANSLIKKFIK